MNTRSQLCGTFLLLIVFITTPVFSQKDDSTGPKFDVADFNRKFETVKWLVVYDEVAWKTSDVVVTEDKSELAKLGTEWFCFQDAKEVWHAFYGKLVDGRFQTVFHYIYDARGKIARSTDKPDQKALDAYAIALSTAKAKLKTTLPAGSPIFNQYIRKENDGTFSVWMLPAFQPDGTAVYGGEAYYSIGSNATKILKEEGYFQSDFHGFKSSPPREIWLNYRELEKPTLGTIFFVWYYRPYFTKIFIDNANSTSSLVDAGNGDLIWVHVEKDVKLPAKEPK